MTAQLSFGVVCGTYVRASLLRSLPAVCEQVREGYLLHGRGQAYNPNSYFLSFPAPSPKRIIALPARIDGGPAGIKWIASFPENLQRGIPRASAVVILNDPDTGYPFACLEASVISALRTAASAVLFAHCMRPHKRAQALTLVGTGLINRYLYSTFLRCDWSFHEVHLYDRRPSEAQRFAREVLEPQHQGKVHIHEAAESAVSAGDVVGFATTAGAPYLRDPCVLRPQALVLHLSLRDLAPEIIAASDNVTDSVEHVLSANTSLHLTALARGDHDFIAGTIFDVLTRGLSLRGGRPTVFSPFGLGVLDLVLAWGVYQQAVRDGAVQFIPNFFGDLTR